MRKFLEHQLFGYPLGKPGKPGDRSAAALSHTNLNAMDTVFALVAVGDRSTVYIRQESQDPFDIGLVITGYL